MEHPVEYSIKLYDKFTSTFGKFSSGMDRITRKVSDFGRTADSINRVSSTIGITGRSIDGLNDRLRLLESRRNAAFDERDIRRYNAEIRNVNKELQKLENMPPEGFMSRMGTLGGFGKLIPAAAGAIAVAGISKFNSESIETVATIESMQKAIKFASKDSKEFGNNMVFLEGNIIGKLKMPIMETYEGFKTLSGAMIGTKLQGQGAREMFESVSIGARVMGLSGEDTKGVFLALGQMMSKGKVSAEELNGQLGERLPGALGIAARAMGMSKSQLLEMMQQGKLMSEDFLPKFAEEMRKTFQQGLPDALDSTRAKMDEFANRQIEVRKAWADTFGPLNDKLREIKLGGLQMLIDGFNGLKSLLEYVRPLAEAFGMTMLVLLPILAGVAMWANWNTIAFGLWAVKFYAWTIATKVATAAQWLFNAAMWANPLTWVIAAIFAMVVALVALYMKVDKVRGFIWALWESIKELGSIIADFFGGLWDAITTGDTTKLKNAFKVGERLGNAWSKGMEAGINDFNADKLEKKLQAMTPGSATASGGSAAGGTITDVISNDITSGGSRPVNVTLNLSKLLDNVIINAANLKEGASEIEKIVVDTMLRVVNSGNAVQMGSGS